MGVVRVECGNFMGSEKGECCCCCFAIYLCIKLMKFCFPSFTIAHTVVFTCGFLYFIENVNLCCCFIFLLTSEVRGVARDNLQKKKK